MGNKGPLTFASSTVAFHLKCKSNYLLHSSISISSGGGGKVGQGK
jgi:hypothetical protein